MSLGMDVAVTRVAFAWRSFTRALIYLPCVPNVYPSQRNREKVAGVYIVYKGFVYEYVSS